MNAEVLIYGKEPIKSGVSLPPVPPSECSTRERERQKMGRTIKILMRSSKSKGILIAQISMYE